MPRKGVLLSAICGILRRMTGKQLKAWRTRHKLSATLAAQMLGVSADTWARWERRAKLPLYVGLACAAISHGLPPAEG